MKLPVAIVTALSSCLVFAADTQSNATKLIDESANVFNEIVSAPDSTIPQKILNRAQCIGIVPNLKRAGFIVGGKYGKGVLTCRTANNAWSAPSIIKIEGGSFGAQIGAGETDVVFVVQNKSGEEKLMQDKFTIGADASVMAGPVGRSGQAETDAQMHAEILAYSRSRGLFAGVALGGSTLRPDNQENAALYGRSVTQQDILAGNMRPPASARSLLSALATHAGRA